MATKRTSDRPAQRRDKLARSCKRLGIDAFVVSDPTNVSYLTGFSGDDAWLVVPRSGRGEAVLLTDGRFPDQVADECPGLEFVVRKTGQRMPALAAETLSGFEATSAGFESHHITVAMRESLGEAAKTVEWKPCGTTVEEFRAVKDKEEITAIRGAITIAEKAFQMLRAGLRGEDDEKSLADAIESYVRRAGGLCTSFPPIVAVGPWAALPHAVPGARRVTESELLLVDWGARSGFYCSDLTRILTPHRIGRKLEKVHDVVSRAHQAAIAAIHPGAKASDIDAAARRVIEDAGFGKEFNHSVGHGLGMQVHEAPGLRQGSDTELVAGMVVTVEPGIYLPGWGGVRLEDDVLVTKDGHEVMSSLPTDWAELAYDTP